MGTKATLLLAISLVLLVGGCSGGEPTSSGTGGEGFQEGTLSSNRASEAAKSSPAQVTGDPARDTLLRIEGGEKTRFSGICTVDDQEEVISGTPSKTYSFDQPFSCTIQRQGPGGGNLKVTVVADDSTRSVQQTNAEGGTIEVSHGLS